MYIQTQKDGIEVYLFNKYSNSGIKMMTLEREKENPVLTLTQLLTVLWSPPVAIGCPPALAVMFQSSLHSVPKCHLACPHTRCEVKTNFNPKL